MEQTILTPFAQRLLGALRNKPGAWLSRTELAADVGKRHLNPYNLAILGTLCKQGLIAVGTRPNKTPIGYEIIYRVQMDIEEEPI